MEKTSDRQHVVVTEQLIEDLEGGSLSVGMSPKVRWNGIMSVGQPAEPSTTMAFYGKTLAFQQGFTVSRDVLTESGRWITVLSQVVKLDSLPAFLCKAEVSGKSFTRQSHSVFAAAQNILRDVKAVTKRKWSADFFGFHMPCVQAILSTDTETPSEPESKKSRQSRPLHPLVVKLQDLRRRQAGPTSSLKRLDAQANRNKFINELVAYASFGDVQLYIRWLVRHHHDLMSDAIDTDGAESFCEKLTETLLTRATITLSEMESAELLFGRASLSQRAYKALKKSLSQKGVILAAYDKNVKLMQNLPIGSVSVDCGDHPGCMCAVADFQETMQHIFSCKPLVDEMKFPEPAQQAHLFQQLHSSFPDLYEQILKERPNNRTIFIRETGDNFRSAGRQQTEQDSFTLLNLRQLITSPTGQFVNGLWRGPETRDLIERHMHATFASMEKCVRNGLTVTLPDGTVETFNVVLFYIADYGHKKEVLGRASVSGKFGCPHCKKPISQWGKITPPAATYTLPTSEMIRNGSLAERSLGKNPDKDSSDYTKFHHTHFGQTGKPLLSCFAAECNLSCALHTILALHRQLWKYVDHVITTRNQAHLLAKGLQAARCQYMAFQVESYFRSLKKNYDGNEKIKMTGEDCRLLELNVRKFVEVFCAGQPLSHPRNETLQHVVKLYTKFHDIAQDLRSTSGNIERARSFQARVKSFLQLFRRVAAHDCTERVMYVHVLLDHIPAWIKLWQNLMDWGYGVFTSTSGEHLNKQLKFLESGHTDLSRSRYQQVLRLLRVRMFHFTTSVLDDPAREMTCSRCKQKGHNRKNKSCPMHPSQPPMEFDEDAAV